MKLSTRSRYGLRFMIQLAQEYPEGPTLLKEIAKREEISEKYLSLIVIPLKGAGLIHSARGAHGGYRLARSPSEISVFDVVELLEGDISPMECIKNPSVCSRKDKCSTWSFWCELYEIFAAKMKRTLLKDFL